MAKARRTAAQRAASRANLAKARAARQKNGGRHKRLLAGALRRQAVGKPGRDHIHRTRVRARAANVPGASSITVSQRSRTLNSIRGTKTASAPKSAVKISAVRRDAQERAAKVRAQLRELDQQPHRGVYARQRDLNRIHGR